MSIQEEIEKIRRQLNENNKTIVSVALFGQPGAGKSSLINGMIGKKVAEVGVETDKTTTEASYISNGLRFVDLPGYGTKNFPKEGYFERFKIQEFDLFLCVTSGKLHAADTEFFQELVKKGKVCIYIVNKHDQLWEDGVEPLVLEQRKRNDIIKHVGVNIDVIFTSCKDKTGFDILQTEIAKNLDSAKKERWLRGANAYSLRFLAEKRQASEKYVAIAAAAAAVNGINPIPGADIALDLSILANLFKELRETYGLNDKLLNDLKHSPYPIIGRLANNVI